MGNGSIPRFRNLISLKVSSEAVHFIGTKASGCPSWPGVIDSTKAEYIGADQLPSSFRLQLGGGPYIPISPFVGELAERNLVTHLWQKAECLKTLRN